MGPCVRIRKTCVNRKPFEPNMLAPLCFLCPTCVNSRSFQPRPSWPAAPILDAPLAEMKPQPQHAAVGPASKPTAACCGWLACWPHRSMLRLGLHFRQRRVQNGRRRPTRAWLERAGINAGRTQKTKRGQHVWFERFSINAGFTDPHAWAHA